MAARLTPFSRILITLVILALIFFGVKYVLDNTDLGKSLKESVENMDDKSGTKNDEVASTKSNDEQTKPSKKTSDIKVSDDDVLVVQVFTWGGYAPGIYFNEGFDVNKHSRYYKDYGLKVKFELIDDFDASRVAFMTDKVHLLGNEVSAMATEMERLGPADPQVLMQVDWSRGGDAIVVKRNIKTVNDLKGKRIAVAPFTPSQTFLIFALESAGLKLEDVKVVEVPSAIDAAAAFRAGDIDAAVVWSPDDVFITRDVAGSRVLQSTKQASHIIADVFMVKKDYAEKNKAKLAAFYEGWMRAAAEINSFKGNKEKAAKILSEGTVLAYEDGLGSIENVRLTTHGDNMNFFGKNINYKGVTGLSLYNKMGNEFEKRGMAPAKRPSWREMALMEPMMKAKLTGKSHEQEGGPKFSKPKKEDKAVPAFAVKPVSITFPTGSSTLGNNAKTLIDIQFADVMKAYGQARVRVEGNTDNTGSRALNMKLSEERAQAVAKYLQDAYKVSPQRLIIKGNGPDKPVVGCEKNQDEACRAKNRRTEFQLLPTN